MFKKSYIPWFITLAFISLYLSTIVPGNITLKNTFTKSTPLLSTVSGTPSLPSRMIEEIVARVIDGDTIELSDSTRIRLIGIDTPESGNCYSDQSTNALRELIEGKNIKLEMDVQEEDKYGRTLAYIYLENIFVNEKMLEDGFAKLLTIPPDVKYSNLFIKAQNNARNSKLGLWADGICKDTNTVLGNNTQTSGCLIKGNISSKGEKIYHVPGQKYYEKTKIEPEKGEMWFCSENEAESSGWRKSKV